MKRIYRVTIHGRTLESGDLRKLLARAVVEKRSMDRSMRLFGRPTRSVLPGIDLDHARPSAELLTPRYL